MARVGCTARTDRCLRGKVETRPSMLTRTTDQQRHPTDIEHTNVTATSFVITCNKFVFDNHIKLGSAFV